MLVTIRKLPRGNRPMSLLDGTSVIDDQAGVEIFPAGSQHVNTVSEFEELRFSSNAYVAKTYVRFLQTFLPPNRFDEDVVLTHCDLRPDNIILQETDKGHWVVASIIDWEDAGFYPSYWEAVKSTRTFHAVMEDDWYLHYPKCILPSNFMSQWLVDYVWDLLMQRVHGFGVRNARLSLDKQHLPSS